MRKYDAKHLLPHAIDFISGLPSFEKGRKNLMPQASGRILEIGIGTGHNVAASSLKPPSSASRELAGHLIFNVIEKYL